MDNRHDEDDYAALPGPRKKRKTFPVIQAVGNDVYDTKEKVFRDNSSFVEKLILANNVLFTRPPQMGKTALLSLAELMLSDELGQDTPEGLRYYPPEYEKNKWYVIPLSFGGLEYTGAERPPTLRGITYHLCYTPQLWRSRVHRCREKPNMERTCAGIE